MTEKKGKTSKFKKPANGREAALVTLFQVWEEGGYATLVLQKNLQNAGLEEMDRRFATELVNGAVKAKGTLDFLVQQLVNRPLQKLEPIVRYILHLGLYQIFYLERIPDSAASNWPKNTAIKALINLSTAYCATVCVKKRPYGKRCSRIRR